MLKFTAVFTFLAMSLAGCQMVDRLSDNKVTNGVRVDSDEYKEVVELYVGGLCTGTFIGDNTIVTAAHCVTNGATPTGARLGRNGASSVRTLIHPNYNQRVGGTDLAIVIFPDNAASSWKKVSQRPPQAGDAITIVGYGKFNHRDESSAGVKRKGTNTLRQRSAGTLEFFGETGPVDQARQGTGANVASSNGDSGGPMFIQDEIVGVTSGGYVFQGNKHSVYVDLQEPNNMAFIKAAIDQGARIPSLTEDDDTNDNDDDQNNDDTNDDDNVIPDTADQDVFLALGKADPASADTFELYASFQADIDRVVMCIANEPTLCNDADTAISVSHAMTLTGREVFKADTTFALEADKTLHVIGYKGDDIQSVRRYQFEAQ